MASFASPLEWIGTWSSFLCGDGAHSFIGCLGSRIFAASLLHHIRLAPCLSASSTSRHTSGQSRVAVSTHAIYLSLALA